MRVVMVLFVVYLLSCSGPKEYTYMDRMVSKKQLDRKLRKITREFVKNSSEDQNRIFSNLEVVYDTIIR